MFPLSFFFGLIFLFLVFEIRLLAGPSGARYRGCDNAIESFRAHAAQKKPGTLLQKATRPSSAVDSTAAPSVPACGRSSDGPWIRGFPAPDYSGCGFVIPFFDAVQGWCRGREPGHTARVRPSIRAEIDRLSLLRNSTPSMERYGIRIERGILALPTLNAFPFRLTRDSGFWFRVLIPSELGIRITVAGQLRSFTAFPLPGPAM